MSRSPSDSRFFAGEIIGSCVLIKNLRVRTHSEVWYGYDRVLKCPAVLKLIRKDHRRAAFFPALADILLRIECPQLIRLFAFFPAGEYDVAEFEYAGGGTLAGRLKKCGRLTLGETVFVLREVLTALAALHSRGIVHRDVKPGNIWLASDGTIRLGDFGIARLKSYRENGPQIFGTPSAMSPEQAVDTTEADERSDFFSLSSTVYEMLTGRPRFPRGEITETLKKIRQSQSRSLREELAEHSTADLIFLLEQMAENDVGNRPKNAEAILAELDGMRLPCSRLG